MYIKKMLQSYFIHQSIFNLYYVADFVKKNYQKSFNRRVMSFSILYTTGLKILKKN
jgi:hypothetical protein